ncbi:MAG: ABC transporter ATP-binding protein/permease [Azoarcus sp.]|jgi:putative ATP-binding cassette transporter|nr:ABC transporter ATP-binding protein/permease [Azoarcus sp.]
MTEESTAMPLSGNPLAAISETREAGPPLTRAWLAMAWRRLLFPYWISEDRWQGRGLLALVIALDCAGVYLAIRVSYWQRDYWDALAAHNINAFWDLMLFFIVIICFGSAFGAARTWFYQALEMRWRNWMTDVFLHRWLDEKAYYRIARAGGTDNPDQRIGEDLRMMASDSLRLSLGLLSNVIQLFSYAVIVWGLSGSLAFAFAGVHFEIPGYMLWIALIYAVGCTWLLEKIGHPLVHADYWQQRYEAHFRFLMMRVRENAEQIAFYSGGHAETTRLSAAFRSIRENWRRLMNYKLRISFFYEAYMEIGAYLPLFIMAPRYFAGLLTLGALQQLNQAFGRVRMILSWFIFSYQSLALLRSVFHRLLEFDAATQAREADGIAVTRSIWADCLVIHALDLCLPNGERLAHIDGIHIRAGERWLIRGPSGAGKSTLLRALAGLWPHGGGEIALPDGAKMFLPQQSYLPPGSLRECLCYPSDAQWFGTRECIEVLRAVRLEGLTGQLEEHDQWDKRLSPGEQQRLAFARVLLHKPAWLFLDESTASLDPDNEAAMYRLVQERLPDAAIVSVAHREGVAAFHDRTLDMMGNGDCGDVR